MTDEERRELLELWAPVMLGYRRMRPGCLINPDIPEQTVAKLRSELADTASATVPRKP